MLASYPLHHPLSAALDGHNRSCIAVPTFTFIPSTRRYFRPIFSSIHHPHCLREQEDATESTAEGTLRRTHNGKSAAFLLRYLLPENQSNPPPLGEEQEREVLFREQDDEKILETSSLGKRTPQFPGSVYANSSLPVVQSVFRAEKRSLVGQVEEVDDEMLLKALEIRRKVTVEIFKEAMKKGKFSITYSENIVARVPEFIDHVMIKAVSLKKFPEFSRSSYNVRARAYIDESQVVPLIRWLKHNLLSYPQIGKLICASRGNLRSVVVLAEWLKTIHVKGRFIGVTLTRVGANVLDRSIEELDEIVEHLETNGVRKDWMGYVVSRCPEILSFSMDELRNRTEFYLSMGMCINDFGTMLFDCPKVFGYLSMKEMNRKVAYLKNFGLDDQDVGRLLAFKPQLMACSIEEKWMPLVKYFYYLGISKDGMRRILTKKPIIDLENTIVPKVQFLRDIGVDEDAIGSVLARFPPLLTYSLYKKIRPVVIFLLTKAGVSKGDIGKVIALGPGLLGCSIANKLDHNVKYFLSLGITLPVLGKMVSDFPMLLQYNTDILRPKYRYLRRTIIRSLQDLIEFPRFFSYSLEERIIPRHKTMVENRVNFKLQCMLKTTDEEFNARVMDEVETRRRFESGFVPEQQLDSQVDDCTEFVSVSRLSDEHVEDDKNY